MSPLDKVRIIVALLYAVVILVTYRHLIPRLAPTGKFLATFMLAAQVLAIFMALIVFPEPSSNWQGPWNLNGEWNFPASLATAQLALVCVSAIPTAWYSRKQSAWPFLYWVGIALLFLLLAREELLEQRRHLFGMDGWVYLYAVVGAVVLVATAALAARSPRRSWVWHVCLAAGLVLGAAAAGGIEQLRFPEFCSTLGFLEDGKCSLYMVEESAEFLGVWLVAVAVIGQFSLVAPSLSIRNGCAIYASLGLVVGVLIVPSPIFTQPIRNLIYKISVLPQELEFKYRVRHASVRYESRVDLRAYRIDYGERSLAVALFASPVDWHYYSGLGYSIHLVDQVTGESVAGADESATRRQSFRNGRRYTYLQRITVEIPPETVTNRALWVVLTTWREENEYFKAQNVIASDLQLLDEKQVILGELALPAEATDPAIDLLAEFDSGFALEKVDLPESAHPGDRLEIPMAWSATEDGADDYVQFLHFGHDENGEWWVYDQQPLGARLPTRLWRSGLSDNEIWRISLPVDLAPGQYQVFTGLYRKSDLERVAVRDSAGALYADARVPVGSLTIENS